MSIDSPSPTSALPEVDDHHALPPGTRFGEFEIVRVLGVGGFGIVYLARDHSLQRLVALKEYMPAALAARGTGPVLTVRSGAHAETYAIGLRSFVNEARLLARFDHPSLVKVYRFWEDNATAYMVMPYLQGSTLREARRAMAQPPDEAWLRAVLDPMLDALAHLHREGVFHRDIAPDNIVLPPAGPPILLDFGAARHVISDRTQSLTAILKPSYAPIEQYADMTAMRQGPWTDLYALGAVMHYLLLGVPPAPATARALQQDAEPLGQRVLPDVSPRFMSAVTWMLGVRPLERPQSVAELRAALNGERPIPAAARHERTVTMAPVSALPTSRSMMTVTLPLVVAAAASGAVPPGRAPPVSMPLIERPEATWSAPQPASEAVSRPTRWGWTSMGLAVVAAAVVFWQFVGLLKAPGHPPVPMLASRASAASAPAVAASAARNAGAEPSASGPSAAAATAATDNKPPVALAPTRPLSARAPLARIDGVPARTPQTSVIAEPASARAACGDRRFFAMAACMDRQCELPRYRRGAECVKVLAMKDRRRTAGER